MICGKQIAVFHIFYKRKNKEWKLFYTFAPNFKNQFTCPVN